MDRWIDRWIGLWPRVLVERALTVASCNAVSVWLLAERPWKDASRSPDEQLSFSRVLGPDSA